ncbi:MAG: gluconate 2-dehydrogenase subunit 3 family protein [Woeseiaceae bacterium]|nr:gluconate 2-dehydrogenase subunit 3 family protein [Woeseiaceae bacterium]
MTDKTAHPELVTRREAILRVSAMFGGVALVGQSAMLAACAREESPAVAAEGLFSADEVALLDEIADTILPETDTPGAKAAGTGSFMALMVTETYWDQDQLVFRKGLETVDARAREAFGGAFVDLAPAERLDLLEDLDAEQFAYMQTKPADAPAHFFRMMKELALIGYFTSEIGYTQAMRYVETPGRFDPCVPLEPGGRTWANHQW